MAKLAIVSEQSVRKIVTRQLAFEAVRAAFEAVAVDRSHLFDVVVGSGLNKGEAFALKSGVDRENKLVGFKCGTYWAGNDDKGLPAHGSTILLLDPATGFPQVLISASYLNGFRTAAANAVAVSSLARSDATVLGVIGAGHQAEQEIRAVAEVRALSLIKISTRSEARASWIADRLQDVMIDIRFTSAEEAVRDSDIVTTVTPSQSPLVLDEWIGEGTHISAMGADEAGKHELESTVLKRASLFADYPPQSIVIGEFQHAYNDGLINPADDICTLGMVTLGQSPGRVSDSQITVFDSSGIAIQDLAMANAIFEAAQRMNQIQTIDF
ncbi:MAG: ornithine cyclodeaminase family protein [Gammaproteobacteria bacterium]|nr:ornithine cyclodeaminase family protein [Gammaproteobacteria bacterium]